MLPFVFGRSPLPQPPAYVPTGTLQTSAARAPMRLPDHRLAGEQHSGRYERAQRHYRKAKSQNAYRLGLA